ncbi:MAG TPA: NAD-binding protein, partial [Candidatus Gracilibacteria bacterium]|nr:NAD-binding protein [Candidatus Gracilibacteria bacterium]
MKIGTIKEVKDNENRVGLTPAGVKELLKDNVLKKSEEECVVFVQKGCGVGAGFKDDEYERAGAQLVDSAEEVVKAVDLLVKVKEPVSSEYALLDLFKGKTLFTYLHLSGVDKSLTEKLLVNRITSIAYETVENDQRELPLLAPMSEVAGVLAVQYGAQFLQKKYHGIGVTLGKIDGADSAEIVVIGAGFVGATAARTAAGMGGNVTVLNRSKERLEVLKKDFRRYLGERLFANVSFLELNEKTLPEAVRKADLLIGAVLIPGARAPIIVKEPIV